MPQAKLFLLITLTMAAVADCFAQNTKQTVVVTNIKSKKGKLMIGWYSNEASYDERKNPILKKKADVDKQTRVSVVFDNIPSGKYAVSVYLDENENDQIDTNFLGIPKEQYGFSNNVLPATCAANFNEAVFEVTNNSSEILIRLK
jgi:uncharacterized protein (DUF2141 family)